MDAPLEPEHGDHVAADTQGTAKDHHAGDGSDDRAASGRDLLSCMFYCSRRPQQ
jgi:hypothetical protein